MLSHLPLLEYYDKKPLTSGICTVWHYSQPHSQNKKIILEKVSCIFEKKNYALKIPYILKWSLIWRITTILCYLGKSFYTFPRKNPSKFSNPKPKATTEFDILRKKVSYILGLTLIKRKTSYTPLFCRMTAG